MMYGLIAKVIALSGKRDELTMILISGTANMPGCLSYIIANDTLDQNAFWITEVWQSKEDHQASLTLPDVQVAIQKGRPLIEGFAERFETKPIGGLGLP